MQTGRRQRQCRCGLRCLYERALEAKSFAERQVAERQVAGLVVREGPGQLRKKRLEQGPRHQLLEQQLHQSQARVGHFVTRLAGPMSSGHLQVPQR